MVFDAAENLTMYADLSNTSASTAKQSQYRVKADMGADLIFDTYTYISLLNDPTPSVFGGSGRNGFNSDIEFTYDHSTADSIVFIGKRYRQVFRLVKATADQKSKYTTGGGYLTAMNAFKTFFTNTANPYFELGNTKVAVEPNMGSALAAGKRISLSALFGDSVSSSTGKYAFTIDKMDIQGAGVFIGNIYFVRLAWKDATTLAIYDNTGKEYIIKSSPVPLIPLYKLWGSKYSGMLSNYKTIYPGTSVAGTDTLNRYHDRLASRPPLSFAFNFGRLNFVFDVVNKRMRIDAFHSQNGGTSGWITSFTLTYTIDANGVYTFSNFSGFTAGGYVENILPPLRDFLLNNKVSFDYYADSGIIYARMTSTTNPDVVMTFVLTQ
jgi:hypothetical protein